MELGHLLTRSGLTYPEVCSKVYHDSMMPVQRLKAAILPLDLPCSGSVTHSGEILATVKSHGKKPDRFFFMNVNAIKIAFHVVHSTSAMDVLR